MLIQEAGLQDEEGQTALMYATKALNVDCVRILIQYEAKMKG